MIAALCLLAASACAIEAGWWFGKWRAQRHIDAIMRRIRGEA